METDIEDNLSTPNSWIPLKAIKQLMGIQDSPKQIPNLTNWPGLPSATEDLPNKCINTSSSFEKLHYKYKIQDSNKSLLKNSSHEEIRRKEKNDYIKILEKKIGETEKKNLSLKTRLEDSEKKIFELTKIISNMRTEYMIKIQNLQEQHEKKLFKTKKDIDYLLKEMNNRSNLIILDDFIRIHLMEMDRCRQNYEDIIKNFLGQINKRENKASCGSKDFIYNMSQSLEEKLESELNNLRERYENQIEKLKDLVTNESLEAYYEDEISTGLNSERATSELKGSILENTLKFHSKSSKSSFFHN